MTADKATQKNNASQRDAAEAKGIEKDSGVKQAREKAKGRKKSAVMEFVRNADPIAMTCFVIVVLAFAVVAGAFINDEYLSASDDTTIAKQGDTVEVEYVGSYIGYYDEEGAVIFDTNIESVADGGYLFSPTYKEAASFKDLSFTVGGSTVLKDFGNAVSGLKVGDVARVDIPASNDGYGVVDTFTQASKTFEIKKNGTMSLAEYNKICGTSYTKSNFLPTSPISGVAFHAICDEYDVVHYAFIWPGIDGDDHTLAASDDTMVSVEDVDESRFTITYKDEEGIRDGFIDGADGMESVFIDFSNDAEIKYWFNDLTDHAEQKGETMYFYIKVKAINP